MPPSQYPFASSPYSSSSNSMTASQDALPVGSNAQRRYFPQPSVSPSTTNLIPASQRTSAGSLESLQSNNSGAVNANFARGPSVRSNRSGNSIVSLLRPLFSFCLSDRLPERVSVQCKREPRTPRSVRGSLDIRQGGWLHHLLSAQTHPDAVFPFTGSRCMGSRYFTEPPRTG